MSKHVKYIGHGHKTDSIHGSGLRWEPGQVREVTPELAEKLLVHTDTWAEHQEASDDKGHVAGKGSTDAVGLSKQPNEVDEPLPVVDFHGMSKKELGDYSEQVFNEKPDMRQSEEALRESVIHRHSKHVNDLHDEEKARKAAAAKAGK